MMEWSGMTLATLRSPPFRSAYRAFALLCVSAFTASNLPGWIRLSLHISPILAMLLVISVIYLHGKFWKKYSSDVSVTFFRIVFNSAFYFNRLRRDYLNYGVAMNDGNNRGIHFLDGGQQKATASFVRIIVLFTMTQHCLAPSSHVTWLQLHMVLAYRFAVVYSELAYSKWFSLRNNNPDAANSDVNAPETTFTQSSTSGRSYKVALLHWVGHSLKILYVLATLHYGFVQINGWFVLLTALYFVLANGYLEECLIKCVESLQLDVFEGLEQYYVSGGLGAIEIALSMFFMVWSLILGRQLLMFLALYANIYQRGQEVIGTTLNVALVEWTGLAQFRRLTKTELSDYDDVCAVCLCSMRSGRKTPCGHYFHGHCLRRCLKTRQSCPMCNTKIGR